MTVQLPVDEGVARWVAMELVGMEEAVTVVVETAAGKPLQRG